MATGFESIENPLKANESEQISVSDTTANVSEQWEECKIIMFSPTEYRIVGYNRSKKRNATGDKTDKKTTSTTSQKGVHESTEQEQKEKVERNKADLYGYLMANPWEYTVVFYDVQKKDVATFSDAVRQHCKNKGYKLRYVHVPVDIADGGFYVLSAVSGVPADVLQKMSFCKCYVLPYGSHHAPKIRDMVQYRRGVRGFISSQNLNEPEVTIIKNPGFYKGDITTDLYAVSTFSSKESVLHFAETGERMGDLAKKYDNAAELYKNQNALNDLIELFKLQKVTPATANGFIKNVAVDGLDADNLSYNCLLVEQKNEIIIYLMINEVIAFASAWNTKKKTFYDLRWDVRPTVYYWHNEDNGELIYAGLSKTPSTRHCQHLYEGNVEKDGIWLYMQREKIDAKKLKARYLNVEWYKDKTHYVNRNGVEDDIYSQESAIVQYVSPKNITKGDDALSEAEARLQRKLIHNWSKGIVRTDIFLGVSHSDVLKAECDFDKKVKEVHDIDKAAQMAVKNIIPVPPAKNTDRLKNYLKRNYEYDNQLDPLKKCMDYQKWYFENFKRSVKTVNGFVPIENLVEDMSKDVKNNEELIGLFKGETANEREERRDFRDYIMSETIKKLEEW